VCCDNPSANKLTIQILSVMLKMKLKWLVLDKDISN
jgi:hypothetical protein